MKSLVPERNSTLSKSLKGGKGREGGKGGETPLKPFAPGSETLIFRAA